MINYYRPSDCEAFVWLMDSEFPQIELTQPSPYDAPWHIQAFIPTKHGEPLEMNFWPHKEKGHIKYEKAVEGIPALRDLINRALREAASDEEIDLSE